MSHTSNADKWEVSCSASCCGAAIYEAKSCAEALAKAKASFEHDRVPHDGGWQFQVRQLNSSAQNNNKDPRDQFIAEIAAMDRTGYGVHENERTLFELIRRAQKLEGK